MKNFKYITGVVLVALALTSCDVNNTLPEIEEQAVAQVALETNNLDFSKYVAIGASFTAGFSDGALFVATQEKSFPNILASKFALAGGGAFNQPLMSDNIGGFVFNGNVIQQPRLIFNGVGPVRLDAAPTTNLAARASGSSFNNFGIPGAKSFHLISPGYGNPSGVLAGTANPYFARMSSSATTTVLADALAQQPTFFTLSEVGGNDVLSYATSGGAGVDQKGNQDPSKYGPNDITDPDVFASVFSGMVNALTANGAKGVVATVPNVELLPFFTSVPYNPVPLDAATATAVNNAYAQYNAGIQQAFGALVLQNFITQAQANAEIAKRTISFSEGNNPVVIIDESLTDLEALNPQFAGLKQFRQTTEEDLLVLPSSSFIGTLADPNNPLSVNGVGVALADQWVLTPEEQSNLKVATDAYNATITNIVNNNPNLAVVDLNALLIEASGILGLRFDNFNLTTSLVTGGLISLDGIHLTSRGYALLANKILESIDNKFGSNFTIATNGLTKAVDFPTNYSPALR